MIPPSHFANNHKKCMVNQQQFFFDPNSLKKIAMNITKLLSVLRNYTADMPEPMSMTIQKEYHNDPFLILISCLLSLRSRDTVTLPVCRVLFARARMPQQFVAIDLATLESIIKPIGFYRQKARTLKSVSRDLIVRFGGQVPREESELLSIKGVGRKTANLVRGQAFGIPALCVDTHVHRLSNLWGLVSTKTPEETERALQVIIPKKNWIEFNTLLVQWGQHVPRKEQVYRLKSLLKNQKSTEQI
jgi:endonuclease-3